MKVFATKQLGIVIAIVSLADCVEPWDRHRLDRRGGYCELLQRQVSRKEDRQRGGLRQEQAHRIAQNASLRNQGQGDKS